MLAPIEYRSHSVDMQVTIHARKPLTKAQTATLNRWLAAKHPTVTVVNVTSDGSIYLPGKPAVALLAELVKAEHEA